MNGMKEVQLFYVTGEPEIYYAQKLWAEHAARLAGKSYSSVYYKRFYVETDERQLRNFMRYVKVQRSGRYNMLTPQAQAATGLDRAAFLFCIENYEELQAAVERAEEAK